MSKLAAKNSAIVDVRGRGLMWGIELDRPAGPVARALLEKGFVVGTARDNVLRLLPPFIVPKKALAEFMSALEATLVADSASTVTRHPSPVTSIEGALSK